MPTPGRLTARRPALGPEELASRFRPPRRFAHARFGTYEPNPAHPSQAAARAVMESFVDEVVASSPPPRRRWAPARPETDRTAPGRYVHGAFGVGKTHLLAAAWHAAPFPKAYLTFAELTAVIGFLGMEGAAGAFSGYRLLCIDEFEPDDAATAATVVTFLRAVVPMGVRVAVTSQALPAGSRDATLAAIASWFDVVRVDGPDYARSFSSTTALSPAEASELLARAGGAATDDGFGDVLAHLRRLQPVQLGPLVDGVETVVVRDVVATPDEGAALAWAALVDEMYDHQVTFGMTGCDVGGVFDGRYRQGAYRATYARCERRLAAMLGEAHARLSSP